jgi:signal transduction histidine kinase
MNAHKHAFHEGQDAGEIIITVKHENDTCCITFKDNGVGMPTQVADNIFEPFFTTARGHGGSGLGMSIVYNLVVHKLEGSIECTTQENQGTVFTLLFKHQ